MQGKRGTEDTDTIDGWTYELNPAIRSSAFAHPKNPSSFTTTCTACASSEQTAAEPPAFSQAAGVLP